MKDAWDDILDPDERIIWQGRPDSRFLFEPRMIFTGLFGIFFAGIAVLWMIGAAGAGGITWMFGLIHLFAGLAIALGPLLKGGIVRRYTWYSLSTKRAFIATKLPFMDRRLTSYPIGPHTPITFTHDIRPSVYFGRKTVRKIRRKVDVPVGFEMIDDGQTVLRLMEDIQRQAHP